MAINLGSAYGKVSLDTKGMIDGANKGKASLGSLEGAGKKLGDSMVNVGKILTASITVPLAALSVQAVKLASDLVETESKVKVVFGNMSDYVMDWSENSAQSMHLSRQQALEAAGTFGNLFVAMKIGRPDAAKMSTTLVQLAADLGSINNIDPTIALMKLKSGIVGETEAVRDLGIDLRMTVVEAKAAEMGFQKLNGQFSQGDLIAARYAIIMEQTAVAQGDIARTGGELAGQMVELNAQWKDALTALGKNLLPIVLKFVTFLNDMLDKFNKLSPAQQKVIGMFVLLLGVVGPLLMLFGTLIPMIRISTHSLNPLSGGVLGLVFSFVKLISALAIVVKILTFFGVSTGPIGAAILGLNTAIVGAGASILAALTPVLIVLGAIAFYVGMLYIMWRTNFLGMRDNVTMFVNVVKSLWAAFTAFLRGDTDAAMEHLGDAFEAIKERFAKVFNFQLFMQNWQNFLNWLRNALTQMRTFLSTAFTNVKWGDVGKFILLGIANGMLLGLPKLIETAAKVAKSVLDQIKKSLGISSPSAEAMKLGAFTAQGFALGMQTMKPDDMARSLTKPITQNSNSNQQVINQYFASGLTLTQVRGMIEQNNEQLVNTMVTALSG